MRIGELQLQFAELAPDFKCGTRYPRHFLCNFKADRTWRAREACDFARVASRTSTLRVRGASPPVVHVPQIAPQPNARITDRAARLLPSRATALSAVVAIWHPGTRRRAAVGSGDRSADGPRRVAVASIRARGGVCRGAAADGDAQPGALVRRTARLRRRPSARRRRRPAAHASAGAVDG